MRGLHSLRPAGWGQWTVCTLPELLRVSCLLCAPSRLLQSIFQTHLNKPILPHKGVEKEIWRVGWVCQLPSRAPTLCPLSLSYGVFFSPGISCGQGCGHPLGFIGVYCKFSCQICAITAAQCITEQCRWQRTFRGLQSSLQTDSIRSGCSASPLVEFLVSPGMEIPQTLWALFQHLSHLMLAFFSCVPSWNSLCSIVCPSTLVLSPCTSKDPALSPWHLLIRQVLLNVATRILKAFDTPE